MLNFRKSLFTKKLETPANKVQTLVFEAHNQKFILKHPGWRWTFEPHGIKMSEAVDGGVRFVHVPYHLITTPIEDLVQITAPDEFSEKDKKTLAKALTK